MKKVFSVFVSVLLLLSLFSATALAANESNDLSQFAFPKPSAPQYFAFESARGSDTDRNDSLKMICLSDETTLALSSAYSRDNDAFYEKYGISEFNIYMQYDISLDSPDNWQYSPEWDTNYYVGGLEAGFDSVGLGDEMMDDFDLFWLTYYEGGGSGEFKAYADAGAIITEKHTYDDGSEYETYHFDLENHSLYIRCRYYMEWQPYDKATDTYGDMQHKTSEWSDVAVFSKDNPGSLPAAPTVYAAPVISDLKVVPPDENETFSHLEYVQSTPESVYLANVYYNLSGDGDFEGLETQVSVDGGDWIIFSTADSGGDWCLSNGNRTAYLEDNGIVEGSNVKLRVRFLGSHGPSEWSNVLDTAGGETNPAEATTQGESTVTVADPEAEKCSICGFCPAPLGLCIFIWIAIVVVAVVVIAVVVVKKKKRS